MNLTALHTYLSGIVQGVGMRHAVMTVANEIGVSGYVRNLADGRVEVYAEGEEDRLNEFHRILENNEVGTGQIDSLGSEWKNPTEQYEQFNVVR